MSSITPELLFADSAWLRGLTRRLVRDPDAADDLEQEVALAALSGPRPAGRAWLAKVARNLAALVHRRSVREARRLERLAQPEAATAAADLVATAELQQRAVAAVLALSPTYRDTILLRFLRGMSIEATARHLGVPVETVRTRQKRGLAQLRAQLLPDRSRGGAFAALLPVGLFMKVPVVVTAAAACLLLGLFTAPLWFSEAAAPGPTDESPVAQVATASGAILDEAPVEPAAVPQDPVREAVPAAAPVDGPVDAPVPAAASGRGDIEVTVARADGSAGADVSVLCRRASGPARFAKTDAGGVARFAGLLPGDYSVASASAPPRSAAVDGGGVTSVRLVLPEGRRVTGQVLDPDGVPVPGAEIISAQIGIWPAWPYVVASTDRNGRFDVGDIGLRQSIGARHPQFGVSHSHVLSSDPQDETEPLVLQFEAGKDAAVAAVRGRVVDSSRRPIADAWVQVSRRRIVRFGRDGKMKMPPAPALARSDDKGEFVAEWLGAGEYELFVYAEGYASHRQKVEGRVDSREVIEVQLARGATLSGVVTDENGQPVAGASVRLPDLKSPQRVWIRAGEDGSFRFEDLPPGPLVVWVTHRKYSQFRQPIEITGTGHHERDIVLESGSTISGRLVDDAGQPLVGWLVSRRGGGRYARSDAEGRFKLVDCKPEGNRLQIRKAYGYVPFRLILPDVPASATEREIRVGAATAPTAKFTGQCVDPNGVPLAGVRIQLSQERSVVHQATRTGPDGSFEVGPLPPGHYRVRALHKDYEFEAVERDLGAHAIEDLQQLRGKEPR